MRDGLVATGVLLGVVLLGGGIGGCLPTSPSLPPVSVDAELSAQIGGAGGDALPILPDGFERGMNLDPIGGFGTEFESRILPTGLSALARLGVGHVALIPSFFQERLGDTSFTWRGSREAVREETHTAIRVAHRGGFRVLLKPHLWLRDRSGGKWRGDIDPTDADWPAWSAAYRSAVMEYAALAAQENVEALSVGSELSTVTIAHPDFWRELVAAVRQVFPGTVTYAANWHDEFELITWWDAVDVIGVDAFWPLIWPGEGSLTPDHAEQRLEDARRRMEALSRAVGKPVLITEIGYRSAADGASEPWLWHDAVVEVADPEMQAIAYRAIARVFGRAAADPKPWLQGVYFWLWSPDLTRGGPNDGDFTPRGKPAEGVVGAWFGTFELQDP